MKYKLFNKTGPAAGSDTQNRKLTILHSNDIHGAFESHTKDGLETGGLALLSGYVQNCRKVSDNVVYAIAGDLFCGSILDADTNGLATIAMMNKVAPDVVTLGNHEVDYGIEHLFFLEKCAEFPIINSNMIIPNLTSSHSIFLPVRLIPVNGVRVLFIGLLTPDVIEQTKMDTQVGEYIGFTDPIVQLKKLYDTGRMPKADITILLTHIGLAEDIKLAEKLDPAWKVDLIIGGHSHDLTEEPVISNGIPIVQVGTGSDTIGRFDIEYSPASHRMISCDWQCVPVNSDTAEYDQDIKEMLEKGMDAINAANSETVTRFARQLTHPDRLHETELGDLYCDAVKNTLGTDIAFIGSGSIRTEQLGPVVTMGDLKENFPYSDRGYLLCMTGAELKKAFDFIFKRVTADYAEARLYQVSDGVNIIYDTGQNRITRFDLYGKPIMNEKTYTVAAEKFLYQNMKDIMGFDACETENSGMAREFKESVRDIILDYLRSHDRLDIKKLDRIIYVYNAESPEALSFPI